ncbi:metal ABC transporter ATP-binding protein [Camelliibacillus cellulosilyticus]|uniref:Metal ABC transporter ATP-binding protein n=1 Tax=Camelliibacillus cellulosilyticus TaxID=2174486 RepID=A0ABV9GK01_9BACL
MERVIEINQATIRYDKVTAVENIQLTVDAGDFLAIAGPNGGGKSSLMKGILNLVPLANGEIKIFGRDHRKAKGLIGYIPQQTTFDHRFPVTVKDVVLMGRLPANLRLFHRFSKQDHDVAFDAMKTLGLASLSDRAIGDLSGGQRQKVLLARALATEPKLLILDEPTASLDPASREQFYQILSDLNKDMTIIMISHDDQSISRIAKKAIYLNKTLIYAGEAGHMWQAVSG